MPEQRTRTMVDLDKLNKKIADAEWEIEGLRLCNEEDAEVKFLETCVYRLKTERYWLLNRFPEVRFWQQRFANK
jgi:hypothetical protein